MENLNQQIEQLEKIISLIERLHAVSPNDAKKSTIVSNISSVLSDLTSSLATEIKGELGQNKIPFTIQQGKENSENKAPARDKENQTDPNLKNSSKETTFGENQKLNNQKGKENTTNATIENNVSTTDGTTSSVITENKNGNPIKESATQKENQSENFDPVEASQQIAEYLRDSIEEWINKNNPNLLKDAKIPSEIRNAAVELTKTLYPVSHNGIHKLYERPDKKKTVQAGAYKFVNSLIQDIIENKKEEILKATKATMEDTSQKDNEFQKDDKKKLEDLNDAAMTATLSDMIEEEKKEKETEIDIAADLKYGTGEDTEQEDKEIENPNKESETTESEESASEETTVDPGHQGDEGGSEEETVKENLPSKEDLQAIIDKEAEALEAKKKDDSIEIISAKEELLKIAAKELKETFKGDPYSSTVKTSDVEGAPQQNWSGYWTKMLKNLRNDSQAKYGENALISMCNFVNKAIDNALDGIRKAS